MRQESNTAAGRRETTIRWALVGFLLVTVVVAGWVGATGRGVDAEAEPATRGVIGADVIIGDLHDVDSYGSVGGISAYAVGTTSCNKGDEDLLWEELTTNHPVIAQNMYRLKDGRLEQIGQSWLKHGFAALTGDFCGFGCNDPGSFELLGVGCSDPYSAGLNGSQGGGGFSGGGGLGPRSEVNASTGAYLFPYGSQGMTGDDIYKRLQVPNAEIDPALNPGARYFVEGHYIANDDAAAGNDDNNASYREINVASNLNISLTGSTQQEKAGIMAWPDNDATVQLEAIDVAADGRFYVASRVQDNGDGTWRYDYAIQNYNSHRSARLFAVPIPSGAVVTAIGFHDVSSHSGEPYALTDWPGAVVGSTVTWQTDDFATDPNANALRWSTMYNFWFTANVAPGSVSAQLGLFRPGSPSVETATVQGPGGPAGPLFDDGFESGDTSAWTNTVN